MHQVLAAREVSKTCISSINLSLSSGGPPRTHVTGTLYSVIVGYSGLGLPKPRPLAPPGEEQDPYA